MREAGILIDLYEDEKVVLVIRRHWLAFLQSILITVVLLVVFLIVFFTLNSKINSATSALCLASPQIADNLGKGALIVFGSMYLLATCAFFYVSWLDYYLDIFMITNKRILRIEQLVLFGQNISETSLQHIQDVSSRVRGIIYTILSVGTVFIETAGERANFTFNFIRHPGEVAAQILEMQKEMWGDEGFKEDMTVEKKKEKIEKMNTGDALGKKEQENKVQAMEIEVQEPARNASHSDAGGEQKKEPYALIKKMLDMGNKFMERKKSPDIQSIQIEKKEHYSDGRKITPNGVIWQSEQEISEEIIDTLNNMEG